MAISRGRRRAIVASLVACALVGGALIALVGGASGQATYPAAPSAELSKAIEATAVLLGDANLDKNATPPQYAEVVLTTRGEALTATSGDTDTASSDAPVYLVQLEGRFAGYQEKLPSGGDPIGGQELYFIFDPASGRSTDWGIMPLPMKLSSYGEVTNLSVTIVPAGPTADSGASTSTN